MTWVILLVLLVVVIGVVALMSYNGLIKLKNQVQEAWHQIDVETKRRHDLVPNLVNSVKGYAQHERGTLDDVIRARNAAVQSSASPAALAGNEQQLTNALGRLMAISESYPDLKANQQFLSLQQELASTEDRIAAGRRYYNALVSQLNSKVDSIPSKFFAGPAGVSKAEYFQVEDAARQAPDVSFGAGAAPAYDQSSPVSPRSTDQGAPQGGYPQIEQQHTMPPYSPGGLQQRAPFEERAPGAQGYPQQQQQGYPDQQQR